MRNLPSEPDVATVTAAARARGASVHLLDSTGVRDKPAALDAIAAALRFPDWFGRNLDALYDCLTDLSWLPAGEHVLIWVGSAALAETDPKAYLAIRSVLSDAQRALAPGSARPDTRRLTVVLTEG